MMHKYYQTYGYKEVHTQDFINIVDQYNQNEDVKALIKDNLR